MESSQRSLIAEIVRMIVKIVIGGLAVIFMIIVGGVLLSPPAPPGGNDSFTYLYGDEESQNYLLKLDVMGPIMGLPPYSDPGPFGFLVGGLPVTYGYSVKQTLMQAADNTEIKGIFIHMATPGGTVFGSKAIFDGIADYREKTGNPVIVYIEGLAASGGVMAMVGADAIYADEGSFIGSIGIIGGIVLYYDKPTAFDGGLFAGGVTTEGGIEQTVIYAGRGKDFGNPFRRLTPEETAVLQEGVDTLYQDFVNHVAGARHIEPSTIEGAMGAQIFENRQAQSYKLIDGTRSFDGAVEELAKLAELGEDYQLVRARMRSMGAFARLFMWGSEEQPTAAEREGLVRADLCAAAGQQVLAFFGNPLSMCGAQ